MTSEDSETLTIICVEGLHDFYFFKNFLNSFKNFIDDNIVSYWQIAAVAEFFKRVPKKILLRRNNDFVLLIQGNGKEYATGTYLIAVKDFLRRNSIVKKLLLIVDTDHDTDTRNSVLDKIKGYENSIDDLETERIEDFKSLSRVKLNRYPKRIDAGVIDINPNLEQVLATLIHNYNIIPDGLCSADPDDIISNAQNHFSLNNYEELCNHIFSNKMTEIKTEMTRICLIDTICEFI